MYGALLLAVLDLGTLFAKSDAWKDQSEMFVVSHKKDGFVFASDERNIVNCLNANACTWYDLKVYESRVFFDKNAAEEHITRVEISLFNKGDAGGALSSEQLDEIVSKVTDKLLAPGEKAAAPEKISLKTGGTQFKRYFEKGEPKAELAWGMSKSKFVEYIRLTLFPKDAKIQKNKGSKRAEGAAGKKKIKENVTKNPNGDVYIDNVPMVDQGAKGYCAAAVSERVLRYFGTLIDEHEIAQQAGTSAKGGTSLSDMRMVVKNVGEKNSLGFMPMVTTFSGGIDELEEDLQRYNRAARKAKKPTISLDSYRRGMGIDINGLRAAMDPKVIYEAKKMDPRFKKFLAGVRNQIDQGIPIFWGVTLGLFPERGVNPQTSGGHMRLIIGYNDKKKEILYSDTWGEGHELKRMPQEWAFAITDDTFFLKPR